MHWQLKTGSMSLNTPKSSQVIEEYKQHKLARCALCRIHDLIRGFEEDRAFDSRLAQFGMLIILALLAVSACLLLSADRLSLF